MATRKIKKSINESEMFDKYGNYSHNLEKSAKKLIKGMREEVETQIGEFEDLCFHVLELIDDYLYLISNLEQLEVSNPNEESDVKSYYYNLENFMQYYIDTLKGCESYDLIVNTESNPLPKMQSLKKSILEDIANIKEVINDYTSSGNQQLSETKKISLNELKRLVKRVMNESREGDYSTKVGRELIKKGAKTKSEKEIIKMIHVYLSDNKSDNDGKGWSIVQISNMMDDDDFISDVLQVIRDKDEN